MIQIFREWAHRYFSNPQVVILLLLLAAGGVVVLLLGKLLAPVIAAIVIAFLLDGMVEWLRRLKLPRMASVIVVFVFFVAFLLVIIVVLLPNISAQIGQLLQELPRMVAAGQKRLMALPDRYPDFVSEGQIRQLLEMVDATMTTLAQKALSVSIASVRGIITLAIYLVLVPLLVFFFLKDKDKIMDWFRKFLPENRHMATEVWHEANQQVGNYVRGKVWEILIVWGAAYLTFLWLDVPFAMLLSLFVGLSVIVPYIGATFMTFPLAVIAFLEWGWTSHFMYVMVAYGVLQTLDGNLLVPLLLSEVVNLHPVAIIVAVLIFGGWWGLWGLFFAIPLATLVHAVIKAWSHMRTA
ncbi:MAG: AI-2E family transporter, partial [Proteobacteria bacterium]|nr:AI-2E family transporter [Pseudomonadota bacterium]